MSEPPGYWMHETSGVLRPAVEAYLNGEPLTNSQLAAIRAYLRQWIKASVWDHNPHASDIERQRLADMRQRIDLLVSRRAIDNWLADAVEMGIDPL